MTATAERVLGILLGLATKRSTITYTALGQLLGLNMSWQRDRAELGVLLGEVAEYGLKEWGILLPAIAVGKGDNLPSGRREPENPSGFYGWCAENGIDISDPYKLVVTEQRKVYARLTP
jgi:hypothetical protein